MSAVVCGKRTSFFEDNIQSPPVTKRIRRSSSSSSSPGRVSPPRNFASSCLVDQLVAVFPGMDKQLNFGALRYSSFYLMHFSQLLEKALEECGNDLDLAIKNLNDLCLGSMENNFPASAHSDIPQEAAANEEAASSENLLASRTLQMDGAEWVELFVREMMSASNIDDARVRAARALEALEKSIFSRATAEAAQNFQQETTMPKEQLQALIQENAILKRAVSIQHERQKEFDEKGQELQQLKQLVSQYQEQLRTLESSSTPSIQVLNPDILHYETLEFTVGACLAWQFRPSGLMRPG
ncbi:hypothetical protein AKJ16_DCAP05293 [Drosera capensis]